MVKKLLLATMMVLATTTTIRGAMPDPATEPGGFYIDDVKFTPDEHEGYYVEVPFKAWFSFPASFCHLQITMPQSMEIVMYREIDDDYDDGYKPGEDFGIPWVDNWQLHFGRSENPIVNEHGEVLDVYNLLIYNLAGQETAVWDPVSWAIPSEHYKMFSLCFRYNNYNDYDEFWGKIGDIEITSYMVNYAKVEPWCPAYSSDVNDYGYVYRYWTRTYQDEYGSYRCGDVNGDGEINVCDMNALIDALLNHEFLRQNVWGDISEDGHFDIIDIQMIQEVLYNDYDGWWYTGHTIEVGHSKATARRIRPIVGDINGDGIIDVGDVVELNNNVLNGNTNNDHDIDGDGKADVGDVVTLISIILFGRTPMPVINVEEHSNYYLITATGNGEVLLYINGEPVNNPYYLYFGDEEQLVHITATAREGQKAISETASRDLYVPANW